MRGGFFVVAGFAAGAGISACGGGDDDALRQAVSKTRAARYLVVSQPGGRRLLISPDLLVLERHGRVIAWTRTADELTWRANRRCYARHTDFNRDDVRQERAGVVPPGLAAGRQEHDESPDIEYESTLDAHARIATVRWRAAELGAQPAAGPTPGPRCH